MLLVVVSIAARRADGPLEMIPGGRLSGEMHRGPEPDWSFVEPLETVELQLGSSSPRSIKTGIVVHEGVPYVPVTLAPLKRWPLVVADDPRVVLRADGRLFERHAKFVTDEAVLDELRATGRSKYGPPYHARWAAPYTGYLRLDPTP